MGQSLEGVLLIPAQRVTDAESMRCQRARIRGLLKGVFAL